MDGRTPATSSSNSLGGARLRRRRGLLGTVAADLSLSGAPRAGAASALSKTSCELGGALGIALLGALATEVNQAFGGRNGAMGTGTRGLRTAAVVCVVIVLLAAALVRAWHSH